MFMLVFNQDLFSVGWPRLLSRVLHQSRDFLGSDVSLGSQCGCHLRLFIECVCVWWTKSSNSNNAGLLCCSKPHLVFRIKFTKSHSAKCSLHKRA